MFVYHEDCSQLFVAYKDEWYDDYVFLKKACERDEKEDDTEQVKAEEKCEDSEPYVSEEQDSTLHEGANDTLDAHAEEDFSRHNVPTWAKKLYKKIALLTHPDRVAGVSRRAFLEKLFRQAAEAFQEMRYEDLVPIALTLNISLDLEDTVLVPILISFLQRTKGNLKEIENSLAWLWCENFGDPVVRCNLALRAFTAEGLDHPDVTTLIELIQTREAQK